MQPSEVPSDGTAREQAGELQPSDPSVLDQVGGPQVVGFTLVGVLLLGVMTAWFVRSQTPAPLELPPPDSEDLPSAPKSVADKQPAAAGPVPDPGPSAPTGPTLFERMRSALDRSRSALQLGLERFLGRPDDQEALDALEEALITADVGVATSTMLVEAVRSEARKASAEGEGPAGGAPQPNDGGASRRSRASQAWERSFRDSGRRSQWQR